VTRLRFSTLKLIATSPQAYRQHRSESSPHLRRGSAVHAIVYGTPSVAVWDGRRAGKEWLDFLGQHEAAGHLVVNRTEYDDAKAMADAVLSDPLVRELDLVRRTAAYVEHTIEWDFMGRPFASTPDIHCPDFVVDLKSTKFAKPSWFLGEMDRRHYSVQLALYRRAIQHRFGYLPREAYTVAVESKAPHHVVIYRHTPRKLDVGERTAVLWLEQLRQCEAADHWPGYVSHVVEADVADWDETDEESENDE
jgi:hypothetical protein